MDALFSAILIGLFFAGGMMFKRRDWMYNGVKHTKEDTRNTGWLLFVIIFLGVLLMWNWNS
jgi:hypothetical protein